jgi:hypothetical protein
VRPTLGEALSILTATFDLWIGKHFG